MKQTYWKLACALTAMVCASYANSLGTIMVDGDTLSAEFYDNMVASVASNLAQQPGSTNEVSSARAGCEAAKAIDGDEATCWVPNTKEAWLKVVLPAPTKVNAVYWLWSRSNDNTRSPMDYEIKISTDDKNWQTVVSVSGNTAGQKAHRFSAVDAKYILFDIKTTVAIPAGVAVFKVLNLDEARDSVRDWWDKRWRWRAKIPLPAGAVVNKPSGMSLVRANVDFTDLLKEEANPLDGSSLRLIHVKGGQFLPLPCQFKKDLDFRAGTNATGELLFGCHAVEGEYYLYFDCKEENRSFPADSSRGDHAFKFNLSANGLQFQRIGDKSVSFRLYSDEKKPVFQIPAGAPEGVFKDFQVWKDYVGIGKLPSGEEKTQFVSASALVDQEKFRVDCQPMRRNYYRGEAIQVPFTLINRSSSALKGENVLSLEQVNGCAKQIRSQFELPASGEKKGAMELETASVARGDYVLVLKTLDESGQLLSLTTIGVGIAPRKPERFLYGIHDGVSSKKEVREHLKVICENNFNWASLSATDKKVLGYYADQAIRYDVSYYIRSDPYYASVYSLSAVDKSERLTFDDGTQYFGAWYAPCWNSEKARKVSRHDFRQELQWANQWPSFSKIVAYNDDAWMWAGKDNHISCYCHYCLEKFKRLTGLDAPKASEVVDPLPVEEDGKNVWVRWMRFRTRDTYSDFNRAMIDVKNEVDKRIKLFHTRGLMQEPMLVLSGALYPPDDQTPMDYVSSYYYPSSFRPKMRIITETEIGRMRNREKPALILSNTEYGCFDMPAWLIKNYFYNMLAANHKAMSFYVYRDHPRLYLAHPKKKDLLEEHKRQGELLRRYGPVLSKLQYPARKVALLASFQTLAMDVAKPNKHLGSLKTVYESLMRKHVEADIICEEEIGDGILAKYDVLILPEVMFLPKSVYVKIDEYIKKGKTVVQTSGCGVPFEKTAAMEEGAIAEKVRGLVAPAIEVESEDITVRELVANGVRYYVFVNNYADRKPSLTYKGDGVDYGIVWSEAMLSPVTSKVKLKEKGGFLYDVFKGAEVKCAQEGDGTTFQLALDVADGKIVAVYPTQPQKLALNGAREMQRGKEVEFTAALLDAGGKEIQTGVYPVNLAVLSPDGQNSEYTANLLLEKGRLKHKFMTAINDPPGRWKVQAKEQTTGITASLEFDLK